VIRFDKVSKKFRLYHQKRPRSLQEVVIGLFQQHKQPEEHAWILREVSFQIEQGQTVGIVGKNGAGKSTLLKLMSQIILPSSGTIAINGRVSSLLELGAGFHPDLTGQENVYLYGAILGLEKQQIQQKFDEIVEFAELSAFIDMPVKHYSSGMQLRLAFSTAMYVEPDILLVDEALAVGDQFFQRRCLNQIASLIESGVTVVLVSHDLDMVRRYCSRVIWFDDGAIKADGEAERVIETYLENSYNAHKTKGILARRLASTEEIEAARRNGDLINRWGSGEVEITGVEFLDSAGVKRQTFSVGQAMTVRIHYQTAERVSNPVFGIGIHRDDGLHINGPNTKLANYAIPVIEGQGYVEYSVENLNLLPGTYHFSAVVCDETITQAYDHHHRLYSFTVRAGKVKEHYGVFYFPSHWTHSPGQPTQASKLAETKMVQTGET
jgi:ABC-type polysaccharide/polyol phosphate transport system ATPase subunit